MILVIGDRNDLDNFIKAKEHLIDTEKHHHIYGTNHIITLPEIADMFPFEDKQFVDLILHILSYCNIIYCLKSWEVDNDARLYHDYCDSNGYKIIYSKKY